MPRADGSFGQLSTSLLATLKSIEFAGIDPTHYSGMLLTELGAEVIKWRYEVW